MMPDETTNPLTNPPSNPPTDPSAPLWAKALLTAAPFALAALVWWLSSWLG